jgi:copper ion binding protein
MDAASRKNIQLLDVQNFLSITGQGVEGSLGGKTYFAGNQKMMAGQGVSTVDFEHQAERLSQEGKTPLFVADEEAVLGIVAVADVVKPDSKAAIQKLQSFGLQVHMLTGDHVKTAEAIQKTVGVKHMMAEVMPQEKEGKIAALQSLGLKVAMVGDGINDAPALARAEVGIAIGAGSDIAIESADVVLTRSRLSDVVTLMMLSKSVIRNIRQNLFWAFFYNILGIPLAAGVFYMLLGWKLNPMFAAAAMSFSSVSVVLNALRLRRFKPYSAEGKGLTVDSENFEINEIKMKTRTITVEGMSCSHCSARVEKALNTIDGVQAKVSLENKTAVVNLSEEVSDETLKKAVEAAGYEVSGIE